MRLFICILLLCWSNVVLAKQRLAVLEFRGISIDQGLLLQLSDEARGGAREGLPIQDYDITSRENMKQMLEDMGKDISSCNEECEVTLGRIVGADYVLSGTIMKTEGIYILTLKLHETMSGSLLGQKRVQNSSQVQLFSETYEVSRNMVSEKILSQQQQQMEMVTVSFDSKPNGKDITVLVGGRLICNQTPCTEKAPSGKHEVQFLKKDYFPLVETHNITANSKISVELKSTFSNLTIQTVPSNLALTINGTTTTIQNKDVSPGTHKILVQDNCYIAEGLELNLQPGDKKTYTITPSTKKSGVRVVVYDAYKEPIPAKIYVDNVFLANAPYRGTVPLCSNTIKVEYNGLSTSQTLRLQEHQVQALDIHLK